ncbi:MAG: hypothetical protein KDD90_11975, partial [Sphingomonadaceae bacterium]|nr:hypothetical protein [Sphingomonadaceae bacterium]
AILPESEDQETRALEVAAILRRAQFTCWTAYRGNPKKRGIKARTDGAHTMLYVRPVDELGHEFNITTATHLEHDPELHSKVMTLLGPHRFKVYTG